MPQRGHGLRRDGDAIAVFLLVAAALGCAGARSQNAPAPTTYSTMAEPPRLTAMSDAATTVEPEGAMGSPRCRIDAPLPPGVDAKDSTPERLHAKGQQLILARDGASALPVLVTADRAKPNDPYILGDMAVAFLQCGEISQAVKRAEDAAFLAPDDVDLAANLAQIYQIAGRIDDAIAKYRSAIAIDQHDHGAYNNLAVLLVAAKRYKDAELAAREAVNLAPDNPGYAVNLGYALFKQGRLVDAEMVLVRALGKTPDNANLNNQLGVVLAAQNRALEAKKAFEKALFVNPRHRGARENLDAMSRQPTFQFETP